MRQGRRFHATAGFSMGCYGAAFCPSQRPGYFRIGESTLDISRARTEPGHELVRTREEGLDDLARG
jgi:hypothetical protein